MCPMSRNKDEKSEKSNYGPIALLSCMPKIIEKIMYKSLYKYCVSHGLYINNIIFYIFSPLEHFFPFPFSISAY
jgi:hypothetical protein